MEVVSLKMEDNNTELNLGLGLGLGLGLTRGNTDKITGNKRGFSETVDLKLNLNNITKNSNTTITINSNNNGSDAAKEQTATSSPLDLINNDNNNNNNNNNSVSAKQISSNVNVDSVKPPAKAQVVGWPPVRSYRKNMLAVQKTTGGLDSETEKPMSGGGGGLVKVSMDGAPYLRKVDLKMYKSYQDLSDALGKMFSSFTLGKYGAQGMIDFMNESKLMDILNDSDYVPTYEDKDGDWMLVGDVPWEMFVESCKRLRIMKGKEAAGLAPRAMEKCKNRS